MAIWRKWAALSSVARLARREAPLRSTYPACIAVKAAGLNFADTAAQPTPEVSRIYIDGGTREAKGQVVEAVSIKVPCRQREAKLIRGLRLVQLFLQ